VTPYRVCEATLPLPRRSRLLHLLDGGIGPLTFFTLSPRVRTVQGARAFPSGLDSCRLCDANRDDTDQHLPTETAVTCTRISCVSRGVSIDRLAPASRVQVSLFPSSPHDVWAPRGSTLEDVKRFTTPHPLW